MVVHTLGVPPGLAGARQVLASYFTALPDFHLAIDGVLAIGVGSFSGEIKQPPVG
jgi:hypothetical protein